MAEDTKPTDDYIEIKIPAEEQVTEKPKPAVAPVVERKPESKPEPKPIAPKPKKVVKKAPKKKPAKPAHRKRETEPQESNWLWVVLIIIGLVIIAAVVYLSLQKPAIDGDEPAGNETRIAALVNSVPIYDSHIDDIYDKLPANMQETTEKSVILDQLIDQEVLYQEAERLSITASDEELDAFVADIMSFFGMNEEQLNEALELQGVSREEFDENNRRQIKISKLINISVYQQIEVTEEEVAAYYNENVEMFSVPETAVVRHILIAAEENESEESVEARADDVWEMIDDDFGNFCDLVEDYSQDPGSVATCGEYAVQQNGLYVPEFEEAAFSLDVNETDNVMSMFGYHIMWKVATEPASAQSLDEVKTQIIDTLRQQSANVQIRQYINGLRDDATIEVYPLEGDVEATSVPVTPEEEDAQEEQMVVEVVEPEETMTEPEVVEPVEASDFNACLAASGAVLFGVDWAPDVASQKEVLGDAFNAVNYVDCEAVNAPEACDEINVWPTWVINDQVLVGTQSLNSLARETGCSL